MKVTLKCHCCDEHLLIRVLASCNINILKTYYDMMGQANVKIILKNQSEISKFLCDINKQTDYAVSVKKIHWF